MGSWNTFELIKTKTSERYSTNFQSVASREFSPLVAGEDEMLDTCSDDSAVRAVNPFSWTVGSGNKKESCFLKSFWGMYGDSLYPCARILCLMGQGSENMLGLLLWTPGSCVLGLSSNAEIPVSLHDSDNWIVPWVLDSGLPLSESPWMKSQMQRLAVVVVLPSIAHIKNLAGECCGPLEIREA